MKKKSVRTRIAIQGLIAVRPTLPAGERVARRPTAEHIGRKNVCERWDVPLAECFLVPCIFQECSESMHDCSHPRQ